jgi:thiamine-monophosphate kinase
VLWLAGTVGDSAAGLQLLLQDPRATGVLVDTFRRPVPLLAAGRVLAPAATAARDVSDGLLLDCARLAQASGCRAVLDLDALPLSRAFVAERGAARSARLFAATGGDDYALLVALPPGLDPFTLSSPASARLTRIGTLAGGSGLSLSDSQGAVPLPERLGYEHRSS